MKVSAEEVKYIAQLSRLNVPEADLEESTKQFNQILGYADILQKLDTTGIEPTPYVLPVRNVFREDVVTNGDDMENIMKNAPESKNGTFVVPITVE